MEIFESFEKFMARPADNSELKKEEALRKGVDAELSGHPEEAAKLYEEGERPELVERTKQSFSSPDLATKEGETYKKPE